MRPVFFFSPSYRGDLDRLVLQRRSIQRFYQGPSRHVVAVPQRDMQMFRTALEGDAGCELISQQSIVHPAFFPRWFYPSIEKLAPGQAWRFARYGGKGGWIQQQIAKLMSGTLAKSADEPIVVLDSDLFFVREFGIDDLVPADRKLLVRLMPATESGKHRKHIANSRRLLQLPEGPTDHHFMAYPAILYAAWIDELTKHIERLKGRPWQEVLLDEPTMSEYSIYGVFVEEILKPQDLQIREEPFNFMLWDRASFDGFFDDVQGSLRRHPQRICTVAQSNMNIPVSEYTAKLNALLSA